MVVQTGIDLSCCGEKLASYGVLTAVASTVQSCAILVRGAMQQIDPPKDWASLLWSRGLLIYFGFGRELNQQGKIEVSMVCAGHSGRLASLNLNAVKECQRGHARKIKKGKHSKPTWQAYPAYPASKAGQIGFAGIFVPISELQMSGRH